MKSEVTKEQIDEFLAGTDPMEKIIKIECEYNDTNVSIIYYDDNNVKRIKREPFYPFVWAKQSTARNLFGGDREEIKRQMTNCGIGVKALRIHDTEQNVPERMEHGYRLMFYAKRSMCYSDFMQFFKNAGVPIYSSNDNGKRDYIAVAPVEQYMISTGRRLFKGYDNYDDLLRVLWDLETEGLDPKIHGINQIGIRTNRGFEKIITITGEGEERQINEVKAIREFFEILHELKPDVITGHNTENFDWYFIDTRLHLYGSSLLEFTENLFPKGIYKKTKQQVLKLGGEMEYYFPTVMWGFNITDSLFAVRRAQALNSNIKKADLKYITKFSKLNKPNRVYVPGKIIGTTWSDLTPTYGFDDIDGDWFKFDEKRKNKTFTDKDGNTRQLYTLTEDGKGFYNNEKNHYYEFVTGKYIVERYLLDDLYETDKVEHKYNITNFFICKMLPVSFEKMCTMGTAAVWKYIMLAWSYEHGLAVPDLISTRQFVGGLSRLLTVGYVDRIVKLDYNSLYPSIILSYGINSPIDIMGTMSSLLEYILTQREHYKGLKKKNAKEAERLGQLLINENDPNKRTEIEENKLQCEKLESLYDNMQTAIKVIGNGFFGSYGSGSVFPWSDLECAEETTSTGRQCLRLMISHFTNIGYTPIVGDSFTGDTPLFIKYNDNNLIDIKPISELINENKLHIDAFNREYDYSKKEYKVLCRSGWIEPSYIYRHKTDKDIYEVSEKDMMVEVTQDHSLFDKKRNEIKPTDINEKTELEYYKKNISSNVIELTNERVDMFVKLFNNNKLHRLPIELLNSSIDNKKRFIASVNFENVQNKTKTLMAQLKFMQG